MENSHLRILLYLYKKNNINCNNLIEYINNREYFLNKISDNRKEAKTLILQMINGGFKNKYNDHCLPEDNILGYICNSCNLQIKNKREIPIIFHNGMKYDNSILLNGMSKFKPIINCIGITSEKFKSIEFKFKEFIWMMMEKLMKSKVNIH